MIANCRTKYSPQLVSSCSHDDEVYLPTLIHDGTTHIHSGTGGKPTSKDI